MTYPAGRCARSPRTNADDTDERDLSLAVDAAISQKGAIDETAQCAEPSPTKPPQKLSGSRRPPSRSRLRPLSIRDYELMSPGALQRRAAAEEQERREWEAQQRRPTTTTAPRIRK